ncbi:hypothetical protein ANCCAN_12642 [Ancylostoma caninum]|uniref:7TM GPCR serpentine receptor class x (Srx) domain-containing protein n=1 Tax=Ancylostoma caninum TaxID=29170 RepID=A0A368GAI7_ANCCA|nr:hypothetical protein ANCCAN_12642 [Ancylostoma caninum]
MFIAAQLYFSPPNEVPSINLLAFSITINMLFYRKQHFIEIMSSLDNPPIQRIQNSAGNFSHLNNSITNETDICIKYGVEVVTFPLYRAMLCMQIGFCISSVVLLLLVLIKYQQKLIFTYDLRALFISLSLASLLHASVVAFFDSYQFILSFTYATPCDVFLPREFYIVFHMPFMYSILWIEASQVVMLFGRFLATFSLATQEQDSRTSGKIMFLASVKSTGAEGWTNYANQLNRQWS